MKKHSILLVTALGLGLSGCVTTNNVSLNKSETEIYNKKITYTTRQSKLSVITPLTAITSGFFKDGSLISNKISTIYNDSNGNFTMSSYLNVNLTKKLSKKYKNLIITPHKNHIDSYAVNDFISDYKQSDYVIDNYVTNWKVMYYKLQFGKYFITLNTKMRLIDTKTKSIVSEGYCTKETTVPLTYDALFDNNANGLINESKKLADQCLKQYKTLLKI